MPEVKVSHVDDTDSNDLNEDTRREHDIRSPANPSRPYAKRFGSTAFDAEDLPPRAPAIRGDENVNLSFSEAYDDGAQEEEEKVTSNELGRGGYESFATNRGQYGLSAEAARELAMQFQSAGMSSAGSMAAAQIAHNMDVSEASRKEEGVPTPFAGQASTDSDPWGAVAPSIDDITPQPSAQPSSASNSDNPWG
jgi:hypothetical protein